MLKYDTGEGPTANWLIEESRFDPRYQGKCESIFCLGNGYMGIRAATEEPYVGQTRNTFVAGTFNRFDEFEVTELPNTADHVEIIVWIDGLRFSLEIGTYDKYQRQLNLKTGELTRSFHWIHPNGKNFLFEFSRFVSMDDLHFFASRFQLKSLTGNADIKILSGINGQRTNSGVQHFHEGEKRIFDAKYLQMLQTTTQSKINFIHNLTHIPKVSGSSGITEQFTIERRKVSMIFNLQLGAGEDFVLDKFSNIYTSRDRDSEGRDLQSLKQFSLDKLQKYCELGYEWVLAQSSDAWSDAWEEMEMNIISNDDFNQLAARFAQYHLTIMTPAHDNRFGIAAKALSGEGYKGHSFWDTELFILPFFTFTKPTVARTLLEYRYNTLPGARKKARENGYRGAMFPWESAWMDDGEVTPEWGGADIVTGKPIKIWSGFLEQHISSDIAFAVWQYYRATEDEDFMLQNGYELMIDTGIFWSSRLEWNEKTGEFHINDVVGPDEYKEHVNNDAFTNYLAKWCMQKAILCWDHLRDQHSSKLEELNVKLNLEKEIAEIRNKMDKVYLPRPNPDGIIPQDDTYLSKKNIDLSKYKNQDQVAGIFNDYNLDQINEMQVTKQASVVMLTYLLEDNFSDDVKEKNFNYYEPRTLHDSSLSLSTHAIVALDIGKSELAYQLFQKACRIDLGTNMKSSDHGIHAASLGGIWQVIVFGFAGVRVNSGNLIINPQLPGKMDSIRFPFVWKGNALRIEVTRKAIHIARIKKGLEAVFSVSGKEYDLEDDMEIGYI